MSEENKTLVRRAIAEVWNRGNFDVVSEFVASNIVVHVPTPGNDIHGPEGITQFYGMLRAAFPDLHFTIEDQIAEGDRVVTNWRARGTHKGAFQGIPATGKQVRMAGIDIDRIVNGKVVECWPVSDDLGLMQQLGVVPMPGDTDDPSSQAAMSPTAAEETRIAWNKIAVGYDRSVTPSHMWLGNEGLRRAGLRSGMRFLDVAAGSGALSIPAARLGAKVLATDLSPVMLEHLAARARKEGFNIETRLMDGHALDLDENTFDMVGSQFGVMLFPDMPRGIREMVRVVKPGGHVMMNVYGDPREIEFFGFFVDAIHSAVPSFNGPPMDPPPLPFQLQDPERLHLELKKAGLKEIRVETITEKLEFQSGEHLWDWLINSNPIAGAILVDLNLTKEQTATIQQTLGRMVRERSGGKDPAVLTNPINIGVGTK